MAGVEFAAAEVAAGLLTDSEEVEAQCERLARTGQWVRETGVAEWPDGTLSGRYSFQHALYHEVVYARVAEARRLQLHRRIAETQRGLAYGERAGEIAAELAVHFEAGRDLTRLSSIIGKAGETAARRSAHQEAIASFDSEDWICWPVAGGTRAHQQELRLRLALAESLYAPRRGRERCRRWSAPVPRARELCQQCGEPPSTLACPLAYVRCFICTGRVTDGP